MSTIFKIKNTGIKSESIINFLKELSKDYTFIEILDSFDDLPELTSEEYKKRYSYTKEHSGEGLTINEMENKLYSDEKT